MTEKNDYQILKKHLPQGHDRLDRVENIAGSGIPDLNYCFDGIEGWIEMKSQKEPQRWGSMLLSKNAHQLKQTQKNWFLKQRNCGGRAFILIVTDIRWILIDKKWADYINSRPVEELMTMSEWVGMRPLNGFDWNALRIVLRK